jgi:hypothetical protein
MQYTADIELNVDFPTDSDRVSELVDHLMDGLEVYGGTVTRTLAGRVEVILTVPGDGLRQATSTALAVAHALGYDEPFAVTVMPAKEFERRSEIAPVPSCCRCRRLPRPSASHDSASCSSFALASSTPSRSATRGSCRARPCRPAPPSVSRPRCSITPSTRTTWSASARPGVRQLLRQNLSCGRHQANA